MAFKKKSTPINAKIKNVSKKEGGTEPIVLQLKNRANVPNIKKK
jgi:hypothetical protein